MIGIDYKSAAKRWKRYGEEYFSEGRKYYFQGINLSMQISTFLLGFNVLWFQVNPNSVTQTVKILLTCNMGFLIISLCLGVWSVLQLNSFMNETGTKYEDMSDRMSLYMVDTGKSVGKDYPKSILSRDIKSGVNFWQHKIQLLFLILGIILSVMIPLFLLWST